MLKIDSLLVTKEPIAKAHLKNHPHLGRFIISPLPKGFGYTIANSLRRVLLSAIQGATITSVRVNDLIHEFDTIKGIKQTALHLILNLKNINFKINDDQSGPFVVKLAFNKIGVVKASDFDVPEGLEIVNGDLVIADITDKSANLIIEAIVEKGIGYRDREQSLRDEIGRIPLDADFNAVKLVKYDVEQTRLGDDMNLDKVILDVETNGVMSPSDAVQQALLKLEQLYSTMSSLAVVSLKNKAKKKKLTK